MSFVLVSPETVAAVATDLKRIGASLAHENASAAASTTAVVSAAADEVSTAVAALFSQHAQGYQAAAAQVAAFHSRFVQALTAGAGAYAFAEAAQRVAATVSHGCGKRVCADAVVAPVDRQWRQCDDAGR
ncbi:PE-PGRS family protein [Mycobacterium tuberculosis]|nr:PE-PGRS family protein [Mycobacterium tuberculosis]